MSQSFDVGGVHLEVEYRVFGSDRGPAVKVFEEVEGKRVQLLRFDCFEKDPHYHFDSIGKDDKRDLDKGEVPDPVAWTLEQLSSNLLSIIQTAGYKDFASSVDQDAVAAALPQVEVAIRSSIPEEQDDVFNSNAQRRSA